jgi:hypothetical protein
MLENSIDVGRQWVWVLDVVFGGIITLGYQEMEKAMRISAQKSKREFLTHVFASFAFLFFIIYDVGVYHVLINRFPFHISALSGCRYVLDLLMAFALLIILMRGLSYESKKSVRQILIALSIWHLCAAAWHFAASIEYTRRPPSLPAFLPHFVFIGTYWFVLFIWFAIAKRIGQVKTFQEATNSAVFLCLLSACVLTVSLYRSVQLLSLFGVDVVNPPAVVKPASDAQGTKP